MRASTSVAVVLALVALAWGGLTAWDQAARARLDRLAPEIGAAFEAHAAAYAERGERPPPATWDFRLGRLVEYPPGAAATSGGGPGEPFVTTVVRQDAMRGERLPAWMWGTWVGALPPALFHGLFGAASAGLLALWLRLRRGAA